MTKKEIRNLACRYLAERCAAEDMPDWPYTRGLSREDNEESAIFLDEIKAIGKRLARTIRE